MNSYIIFETSELDRDIYRFTTFARLIEFLAGEFALFRTSKWDHPFENFIAESPLHEWWRHARLVLRYSNDV